MALFDKSLFDIDHNIAFSDSAAKRKLLAQLCSVNPEIAHLITIGRSEENREITAVVLGHGSRRISMLSGSHADEPVGAETLCHFIQHILANLPNNLALLEKYTFFILPHINPDGEARNKNWIQRWPRVESYLQNVVRELPGRDMEFGYPDLRLENSAVAKFLASHAPFDAHFSLHGMGFAEGCMLLIQPSWIDRTQKLRQQFIAITEQVGLPLHDHDRAGEKGFIHISPGFTTTPNSVAMQNFFHQQNDAAMAAKFKLSSMEYIRSLGADPFCMVTELPLFVINAKFAQHRPGFPAAYLKFRETVPHILQKLKKGEPVVKDLASFQIQHLPLPGAMQIQLRTIEAAIEILERQTD